MIRRHERLSFLNSIHFVTAVTNERGSWFAIPDCCRGMLEVFEVCRATLKVLCLGYVFMPDHFHALVVQTADDLQIAELMRRFKRKTSLAFRPETYAADTLWKRRYDDVSVPGPRAVWTKLNYMHWNPVKRKLCEKPEQYPWSSAADYFFDMQRGVVNLAREMVAPLTP